MKRVPLRQGVNLHMYPSSFTHESRMLRITGSLRDARVFQKIFLVALWDEGLPEWEELDETRTVWRVRTRLVPAARGGLWKVLRFLEWTWVALRHFRGAQVACVNPHCLSALPMAYFFRLFKRCKVVYDTHEWESETVEARGIRKRLWPLIEKAVIHHCDTVVVTTDGYGRLYREKYGINNVFVVKNFPLRRAAQTERIRTPMLREYCGLKEGDLLYIYQGLMSRGRGIEIMLRVFAEAPPDRHVVFMGFGPLEDLIREHAARCSNIHFFPGVDPLSVVTYTMGADIGICLIERTCLSYFHTLPNKLLEYLNGGLPSIVSDFPDMGDLVDEHRCGWRIGVDEESLARVVGSITRQEVRQKEQAALEWAREHVWEREAAAYLEMFRTELGWAGNPAPAGPAAVKAG